MVRVAIVYTEAANPSAWEECARSLRDQGLEVLLFCADPLRRGPQLLEFLEQAHRENVASILAIEGNVLRCAPILSGHSNVPVFALCTSSEATDSAALRVLSDEPEFALVQPPTVAAAVGLLLRVLQRVPQTQPADTSSGERKSPVAPKSESGQARAKPAAVTAREKHSDSDDWLTRIASNFRPQLKTQRIPTHRPNAPRPLEYSVELRKVVATARDIAAAYGSEFVGTLHYLAAIMDSPQSIGHEVLRRTNVDFDALAQRLTSAFPKAETQTVATFAPDAGATAMVSLARRIARNRGRPLLTTADFLEAIATQAESVTAQILDELGVTLGKLHQIFESPDLPVETLPETTSPKEPEQVPVVEIDPQEVLRLESRFFRQQRSSRETHAAARNMLSHQAEDNKSTATSVHIEVTETCRIPTDSAETKDSKGRTVPPIILKCDPLNPPLEVVERAADFLLEGKTVCFPTDTVYGVGVDATNPDAVERLYSLKERMREKPIAVLIHSTTQLRHIVQEIPHDLEPIMEKYWPGPLTIVFRRRARNFEAISRDNTIGLRIPNHYVTLAILSMVGRPLATSSANISGDVSAVEPHEALAQLGDRLDMLIDAGRTPGGSASTVLSVVEKPYRILRQGPVSKEEIETLLGNEVVVG
ncbi:MAG: threonylcarbamoyl-AMP synthase [Candidatus Hydrogenedentota bacterium]|nr:MAG: threonylcarbamoyl-AMP synthase [Candidatus Hydrogenedentota bacterium]